MATLFRLPSGRWRVQIRRKGRYISETFLRHQDAEVWAKDNEVRIDQGRKPNARGAHDPRTFGDLIDLHLQDVKDVGRTARRSKAFSLEQLKRKLGDIGLRDLDRDRLIRFGRDRAKEGAGKVTLSIDFTFIKTILVHAAAVHGVEVVTEEVFPARTALKLLGLIGKGKRAGPPADAGRTRQAAQIFGPQQSIDYASRTHGAVRDSDRHASGRNLLDHMEGCRCS